MHMTTQNKLKFERKKLSERGKNERGKNEREHSAMDLACSKKNAELNKLTDELKHSSSQIGAMQREYEWLNDETDVNNENISFDLIKRRSHKLGEEQSNLSNKINRAYKD
eukprot:867337_1